MPTLSEVHVDQILTSISLAYKPDMFVADVVSPPIQVPNRSDRYFIYPRETFTSTSGLNTNNKAMSLRAPGTIARETQYSLSTDSYLAEEYAWRHFVSDAELRHSDTPLNPEVDATEFATQRLLYDNEAMVAAILMEANNYPTSSFKQLVNGAGSAPGDSSWFAVSQANSNPFVNFMNAHKELIKNVLNAPNTLLIDVELAYALSQHPLYVDRYKYVSREGINTMGLSEAVAGMRPIVTGLQYNSAKDGQPFNAVSLWRSVQNGSNPYLYALCCWVNPERAGIKSMHMMKTFDAPDQTTGVSGIQARRYRAEDRKGTYIEVSFTRDYKLITVDSNNKNLAGYLIREYR